MQLPAIYCKLFQQGNVCSNLCASFFQTFIYTSIVCVFLQAQSRNNYFKRLNKKSNLKGINLCFLQAPTSILSPFSTSQTLKFKFYFTNSFVIQIENFPRSIFFIIFSGMCFLESIILISLSWDCKYSECPLPALAFPALLGLSPRFLGSLERSDSVPRSRHHLFDAVAT